MTSTRTTRPARVPVVTAGRVDQVLYWLSVALPIGAALGAGGLLWSAGFARLDGGIDFALLPLRLVWLAHVYFVFYNVVGLVRYGSPQRRDAANLARLQRDGWNPAKRLIVVYVSRGDNVAALRRSIATTHDLLTRHAVSFAIEVVTDQPVELAALPGLHAVVVPPGYTTPHGAQFKARALHYLLTHSPIRGDGRATWLLHCDEETQLTAAALAGIHRFVNDPATVDRIGQGEIQYNGHRYGANLLTLAADSYRTGDDLGRMRLQFRAMGRPQFGIHGSYLLVPAHIEAALGFDRGGSGSLVEDAYFAIRASSAGYRFGWIDGPLREQSPYTVGALLRQRRRWVCGLWAITADESVAMADRRTMLVQVGLWLLGWFSPAVTLLVLLVGGGFGPVALLLPALLIAGGLGAVYLVGVYRNLRDTPLRPPAKIALYVATGLLVPVANLLEAGAVVYAILRPIHIFEIIEKN